MLIVFILHSNEDTKQFDELENRFNQVIKFYKKKTFHFIFFYLFQKNISVSEELLSAHTTEIVTNLIFIQEQKTRINRTIQSMRVDLTHVRNSLSFLQYLHFSFLVERKTN